MNILTASNISASYDKNSVLEQVSFSIDAGEIVGILGANGCGKTTLLKAVAGIIPHGGEVSVCGENAAKLSTRKFAQICGYIPQKSGITIDLTIRDVVLMGYNPQLKMLQQPTEKMKLEAQRALKQVGLGEMENQNYQTLSEGQKQLCILARTLAGKRKLLLLDEPESALDFRLRYSIMEILKETAKKESMGVLVTLHDSSLALNYCDKLVILANRKKIGEIRPSLSTEEEMERLLSAVYGPVSIIKAQNKRGKTSLVMIKEE